MASLTDRGIVTAAFGPRRYREMAVDLALSVREHSDLPVTVVADSISAGFLANSYAGLFHRIVVPDEYEVRNGPEAYIFAKALAIRASPYRLTLFLDADMICCSDPAYLLDGAADDTFRVSGTYHSAATCGTLSHHGIPIRTLIDRFQLDTYAYTSLAAFVFGQEGGGRVTALMVDSYRSWKARMAELGNVLNDELLLGVLGRSAQLTFATHRAQVYQPLDLTFRWTNDFDFVHVAPMRYTEAARIISGAVMRRRRSGYASTPTLYWLSEILSRRAEQCGRSRVAAWVVKKLLSIRHGGSSS